MQRSIAFSALGSVAALVACATLSIHTDYDREADFSRFRSFAWARAAGPGRELASLNDRRIRRAVEAGLEARGYRKAEGGGAPDFLVNYHTAVREKVDVSTTTYRGWRGRPLGTGVDVHQYKQGTLVLDLIDAGANELVWRGWAQGAVSGAEMSEKRVTEAVDRILARFPPPPR